MANPVCFNAIDGSGYVFISERITDLDKINPQIAARMAGCFGRMRRFDQARKGLMLKELKRIRGTETISKDLYEVVSRIIDN